MTAHEGGCTFATGENRHTGTSPQDSDKKQRQLDPPLSASQETDKCCRTQESTARKATLVVGQVTTTLLCTLSTTQTELRV